VAEAARLVTIAMDLERVACNRPLDEVRDHHSVLAALPGADRVEEPHDHTVEPVLLVVGECEELVHCLRVRVRPPLLCRRPVNPAVALLERPLLAVVAIHLGRGRDQDSLLEAVAMLEHDLGSAEVRHECLHGLLDDQPDADSGGQVIDDVALVDELVDHRPVQHRVHHEVEPGAVTEVFDVVERSRGQIVEGVHLPVLVEQELREV
jgi:hypothetical protein